MVREVTKYSEKLRQQIKAAGRELIERADDMVSDNLDLITDFSIYIHLNDNVIPEIQFTTTIISKNNIDLEYKKLKEIKGETKWHTE